MCVPVASDGMETREFPVLAGDDQPVVDRLAAGLGDDAARVLAYLALRADRADVADRATETALRIGTDLSGSAVADAIDALEDRDLVETTTVRTASPGRPPKAWTARYPLPELPARVYDGHAERLLERARLVAAPDGTADEAEDLTSGTDDETDSEGDGATLTVGLNWKPNALQLPLYAARRAGAYEHRGLSVALEHHDGSREATASLRAGAADVAVAGAATVVRAREAGEPIVPIASLFQRPMIVLYTTRDAFGGRFEDPAQLRDRSVGMPIDSEAGILGRLFLSQAGVLESVELVDVRGEEDEHLRGGGVDVVTGTFADPLRLERAGATVDSVHVADQYPIYGPTLVTTESTLARRRGALESFLGGTTAGWVAATESPDDAAEALAAESDADAARVATLFDRAASSFAHSEDVRANGWGWHSPETWTRLRTALDRTDLLEPAP